MTERDFVNMMCARAINLGIYDSLCDPYDAIGNKDQYSSVELDIRKLIEATVKEYKKVQTILQTE